MGIYRLLLALAVLLSHAGVFIGPYNPGVIAVVSFFVISGYVTTGLIRKHYGSLSLAGGFYTDRAMRLFPQYLAYLAAMLVVLWAAAGRFGWPEVTPLSVALNALMVPVGVYMYVPAAVPLNPPTWTLGLEAMFYAAMPVLLLKGWRLPAFLISAAIFAAAYFGWLHTDYYGYRLLPGTLFIFMCGSFLYTREQRGLMVATWIGAAILFAMTAAEGRYAVPYNAEMLLGILIGLPAITLLRGVRYRPMDEALGNLSYGVYLNHFVLLWGAQVIGWPIDSWPRRFVLIAASLALAWLTYAAIEKPVLDLRHRLRTRIREASGTPATA